MTQAEFSKEIGKSRSHVANSIRILTLTEEVRDMIRSGKISFGHAKLLVGLSVPEQKKLAKKIVDLKLSVRDTEKERKTKSKKTNSSNVLYKEIEDKLQDRFMTKVKINDKKGKGDISISYYSEDELTRIIEILENL